MGQGGTKWLLKWWWEADERGNFEQGPSPIGDNNRIAYILNGILRVLVIFI